MTGPTKITVVGAACCALLACGTEPITRFHSLLPAPAVRATVTAPVAVTPLWELLPLKVPAQLENPQWVVRLADDTIALLEHDRWIAPLAEEMRAAVALRLTAAVPPPTSAVVPVIVVDKPWRVLIEVERFDAALGRAVHLEASWLLQPGDAKAPALRCRVAFTQPVAAGMPALGAGQRAVIEALGDAVAVALKGQLGVPPARSCGPPPRA